eukprot:891769-Prorocentrum_minimum.AAC.1
MAVSAINSLKGTSFLAEKEKKEESVLGSESDSDWEDMDSDTEEGIDEESATSKSLSILDVCAPHVLYNTPNEGVASEAA